MSGHTKGPWQQHGSHIYGPDPERIAVCQVLNLGGHEQVGRFDSDARFIVRACNCHDEMLAALKEMREACAACFRTIAQFEGATDALEEQFLFIGVAKGFGDRAAKAIAKAEGRS